MKMPVRHVLTWFLCAVFIVALSGCPFRGELTVQPGAATLSDTRTSAQLSLANMGGGTIKWTAQANQPWILLIFGEGVAPQSQVSGETKKMDILQVRLNADALPADTDTVRGSVSITSNGGDVEIPVTFERDRTPRLALRPVTLHFTADENEKPLEVVNDGIATLLWQASLPEGIEWLKFGALSGEVSRRSAEVVTVSVDRSSLAPASEPYRAEVTFDSNGGSLSLEVSVEVGAFTATPLELDFGLPDAAKTLVVTLRTQSTTAVALDPSITYDTGEGWLSLSPGDIEILKTKPVDLNVTANAAGLEPGIYTASISLTHAVTARTVTIPVRMEVGKPASFRVEPAAIDFGSTNEGAQRTLSLINTGEEPFTYTISRQQTSPWLLITPETGTVETTQEVTLTADVAKLDVGEATVNIVINARAFSRIVKVTINRTPDVKPDKLEVEPRERDFGALEKKLDINIWNEGPNKIDWSIDASKFPAWLKAAPLSGSVGGTTTQTVWFTVDRALAPADQDSYSHVVTVAPKNTAIAPVDVVVRAQPRRFPIITVIGEGEDSDKIPFIMIDIGEDNATFTIRNDGTASLSWQVDSAGLPEWITSISPLQGELAPGLTQTVRVSTDRAGLDQTGGSYRLPITSNDIDKPTTYLDVQVRVPFSIIIGTRPPALNFGRTLSTLSFEVANLGDAGWPLDYVVTSSQPNWLFAEPSRGRSIGTGGAIKDWQFVSVAIDRSRIPGTGASAKLTVTAENVPPNASPVEPVEVSVALDVAELTVESAFPRYRPASLLRFGMLLRDSRQRSFPIFEDNPLDGNTLFRLVTPRVEILEDSLPIDLSETNVFIKKDETLSFAVLIMLDFSGSMAEAAQALVDDEQFEPEEGQSPLEALYIEAIDAMLDEFPDHYKVGLAVFNERNPWWTGAMRVITGAPEGFPAKAGLDAFTSNKEIQDYRLRNMQIVDNGATPLYTSMAEGALTLYGLDSTLPDFDAVSQRILLPITDGRRTTPPGDLTALLEILYNTRSRVFAIGWGNSVSANSLIQMTTESGGHYYSTLNKIVPGAFDPEGNPLTVPIKDNLLNWCRKNPDDSEARSVVTDLTSHVVLSYATLNEEISMELQGRVEVDTATPPLKETFIFDQVPSFSFANDVRLGQIGMHTEGIQEDGSASVRFYADYMPRNITRLVFDIVAEPAQTWTAELIPAEQGGLVSDWNLTTGATNLTVESENGRPLAYADYGNLFTVNFTGLTGPIRLSVSMVEPRIGVQPDSKYFTIPAGIDIGDEPFTATSFPNPAFEFTPPADSEISQIFTLGSLGDLPADERLIEMLISNTGGEHLPTDATLYWKLREGAEYLPGTYAGRLEFTYNGPPPTSGEYYLIHNADLGTITPAGVYDEEGNVIADPGPYSRAFYIDVYYGTLFYEFTYGPYYLSYQVP